MTVGSLLGRQVAGLNVQVDALVRSNRRLADANLLALASVKSARAALNSGDMAEAAGLLALAQARLTAGPS